VRTFQLDGNVDGPELRADAALSQAGDVGVQRLREVRLILPDVELREMILHAIAILPRQIVMTVDQRHLGEDAIDVATAALSGRGAAGGSGTHMDGDEQSEQR